MCRQRSVGELKHFEKRMMNVNGLSILERSHRFAHNEQGLAMLGDLKNVKPGTSADRKTNVQYNNQKHNDACPAQTTAAMLLKMKITTSCPNIAKPHVGRSAIRHDSVIVFSRVSIQNFVPSRKSSPSNPL